MLNKKKSEERGKCPFRGLKVCSDECVFYRKGVRYTDDERAEAFPFEECAFNIIADNLEAMHNRTYMMQKEVGETKNVIAISILKDIGMAQEEQVKKQALKLVDPDLVDNPVLIEDKKDNDIEE
jgi:hypothetical protein